MASGYASEVAGWIGAGPFVAVSAHAWPDPMECRGWAVGGSGLESVFEVPLASPLHPDAYERVRGGMRGGGFEISFDGAGRPGDSAVLLASDPKARYGLRLYSRTGTADRPVSDAIVVEVRSPCFTEARAAVPSS